MNKNESNDEEAVEGHTGVNPNAERYTVFTTSEKWCIVAIVSCAAWFSTLSSFIYYPAIPTLSKDLDVSINKINLTVTAYLSVATIAPTLVGDAADILGRRPIYVLTLSVYFIANLAIALSHSYSTLLGLRALQALAISGTFSVAYGVVADVASPAERGTFAALVSFAITIAPSLGPVLGGGLTFAAGWPWIFWFLCIASGLCLTTVIPFLPETSRNIVGDGSIRPSPLLRLPIPTIMSHWKASDIVSTYKWRVPNPFKSLAILFHRDNSVIILACALLYVVYTCINASLSTLFVTIYNLDQLQAGLIYLPFGIGGVTSTFISGRLLDWSWRNARIDQGLSTDRAIGDNLDNFPVEKARLGVIWIPMLVTVCSVIAFGWVLYYQVHISVPLILQYIVGCCMQLDFSVYNTLLVDKNHRSPAAAQASSNIVRCTLSAVTVLFLQDMINELGIGWTFTFMGGMCLIATGLLLVDYYKGESWRHNRISS